MPFRLYLRALHEVRPWWPRLGLLLLLGLLWTPLSLLAPLPLKIAVDHVLGQQPLPDAAVRVLPAAWIGSPDALGIVAAVTVVLVAVLTVAHGATDWLLRESLTEAMVRGFRGRLLRSALGQPPGTDGAEGSGGTAYRINHDAPAVQWTTIYGLPPLITAAVALGSILFVIARLSPLVAVTATVTALPLILLIHGNQSRLCRRWHEVKDLESAACASVQEVVAATGMVSAFGQEEREVGRFLGRAARTSRARLAVIRLEAMFGSLLELATAVGTAAVLYLSAREVRTGQLTTGELTLIMAYVAQLYGPIRQVGTHLATQQTAVASAQRAFALLDRKPRVQERPDAQPLVGRAKGQLTLEDVAFGYAPDQPVLSGFSLDIPAGSRVGIVGATGSGKTTLLALLNRSLDPDAGSVRLDGVDLRDYRLADLRRQFAVVGQDAPLLSGTVAENIAYGDPQASRARIVTAAVKAKAHGFILRRPHGYDSRVGERSQGLSGGERQRLTLARAYLRDAPILILDEPTSALDGETERAIQEDLKELMLGRTVFLVTHRPSMLRDMDLVLRLEDGSCTLERSFARPRLQLVSG